MPTVKFKRRPDGFGELTGAPFDVDAFLLQPLVARIATGNLVVRPTWYLWEDESFWVFSGAWSHMAKRLHADPGFELVVDTCDPHTGKVLQVIGRGEGSVVPFDTERGRRKLTRYLGPDESLWDDRFAIGGPVEDIWWIRLTPDTLWVSDQSFRPSIDHP
ncbi:pyridoxamine 5'-phosphate oxidase family protein [Streptomyces sp. SH5]|uniref:pyridoxamine 5'-phosphate oxidase family protein n=1 Tax=Streptomyces sp. SH5 TaxID=3041765 RepID=UPI00247807D5|nr:pyridoxamine 5'-phosphate oxidase family protein [Streptomyces sp. SH5]WGP12335.1 pyridoxamine 5'-phosphate oxidase family protein [Streptomyces sp. SH5]